MPTRIQDVIVPERFTPYVQLVTEEKTRLVDNGTLTRNAALDGLMEGGGLTFNVPAWNDLDSDEERVSGDDPTSTIAPQAHANIEALSEIAVRMNRNHSWSAMNLSRILAGSDPMSAIADRVGNYWSRRLQSAVIATVNGVFADNEKAQPNGTGEQNDLTVDISGASYEPGVTDLSLEAAIDAVHTMGDSEDQLGTIVMHSLVYARAKKNNLIDFVQDSANPLAVAIPTFNGRRVIVDDSMPNQDGVFHTWFLGQNALQWGVGTPDNATELERLPSGGDGGGQDVLWNRVMWVVHPTGYAFEGSPLPDGGPSNTLLAHEDSWARVYTERKQIRIARLITREFQAL